MAVDDTGDQAIRKSAIVLDGGSQGHTNRGSEYALRVVDRDGNDICDGLSGGGQVTVYAVTDAAWTQIAVTPLTNRVSLLIQNQSTTSVCYFNYAAVGTPSESWHIPAGGHYGVEAEADATMTFYVRMPTGQSAQIVLNEVADG